MARMTGAAQNAFKVNTPATLEPSAQRMTTTSLRPGRLMPAEEMPSSKPGTGCNAGKGPRPTAIGVLLKEYGAVRIGTAINEKTPRRASRSRRRYYTVKGLVDLAVTVFEFLARTTPAQLVATQLLVVANRLGCDGHRRFATLFIRQRLVDARRRSVFELHTTGQFFGFLTQARLFFLWIFATNLNMRKHTDGVALDRIQQLLKQREGLALVFLLRVLLSVAAQVDTVTQVVHGRQVIFPQVVQHAQEDLLLEGTQGFGAGLVFLLVVRHQQLRHDFFAQAVFVQVVVFVQPLLDGQFDGKVGVQRGFQTGNVPLLRQGLRRNMLTDEIVEHFLTEVSDGLTNVLGSQQRVTHVIDHFALLVGHVIELEQLLADVEVATFHFALRFFDGVGHHAVLDSLTGLHAQRLHEILHAVRGEDTHQAVFERQVETAGTGVTLAAGTATQLVVDTARFVALGGNNVQATRFDHLLMAFLPVSLDLCDLLRGRIFQIGDLYFPVTAQQDVGTATRHVGSNGQSTRTTGLRDDFCFFFVELGVQNLVIDAFLLEQVGHVFGGFDGRCTYQHRTVLCNAGLDVGNDGCVLLFRRQIDKVVEVFTRQRLVRRDDHDGQVVDLVEFERFGVGRTGHAGQFVVQTEVVLERGRCQGLAFGLNVQVFLCFDGLMQALGQATARHGAAGMLVDQQNLAVCNDVLDVAVEQFVRTQTGINVSQQAQVVRRVQALAFSQQADFSEHFLDELVTGFVQLNLTGFLVNGEVARFGDFAFHFLDMLLELGDQAVDFGVQLGAVFGLTGDDQRRTRFVDQNRVDFVDYGEIEFALELVVHAERHVVAQVIEAVFVISAVGDVGSISSAFFFRRLEWCDDTYGQTEEFVQRTHPVGISASEIVVHGDYVNALAGKRIEVHSQRTDQGFTFTGTHFRDLTFVQGHTADQLNVEVAHAHDALARFTSDSKGFRQ
ncbi:hypothetical protein ALP17_05450 [Pseudomonas savastanoi]|uniref:NAD-specific glutamate dehydrogenase n=1 Tax=Pseudomonas savastanoi TaxID=29438 RepID=A0A3M5ZGF5_PSESS|nr:hypothetical protein ALP17_05450 [Pseudomonas savastanoi]